MEACACPWLMADYMVLLPANLCLSVCHKFRQTFTLKSHVMQAHTVSTLILPNRLKQTRIHAGQVSALSLQGVRLGRKSTRLPGAHR